MDYYTQAEGGILAYKAIWVPLVAWFVAQSGKVILNLIRKKRLDLSYLYSPGGMPSAHSALMTSLATTIGLMYGFESPLFAISLAIAFIVMYDAAGVRRTVGHQSTLLNKMLDEFFKGNKEFSQRLGEIIGHTKWEVFAGALLGIAFGLLFSWPW
ncbi:MAG: divergent PAP2 family protein [Dehalococcoidia bacterium]|nr:divergent PAP2 family protein [Dehalococcoidia bacterium]